MSEQQHESRLMGLKEGAAWLGCDFYWFRELVESGQIASLERKGRRYVWPAGIAAFLQARIDQPTTVRAGRPRRVG